MMGKDDNTKLYNAEDIRRYTSGNMSPKEMHAIEKAALDDPFLADAIEGFDESLRTHGPVITENASEKLRTALQKRLTKENKDRSVIPLKSWQAAVAAAILATAGIFGYLVYEDKSANTVLSQNQSPESQVKEKSAIYPSSETDSAAPMVTTSDIKNNQDTPAPDNNKTEIRKETSIPQKSIDRAVTKNQVKSTDEIDRQPDDFTRSKSAEAIALKESGRIAEPYNNRDSAFGEIAGVAPRVIRPDLAEMPASTSVQISDSVDVPKNLSQVLQGKVAGLSSGRTKTIPMSNRNIFMGQVITEDERPLSNAVLKLSDNRAFSTDNNGNFAIPSTDSVIEVEVTMIGAASQNFKLRQDPSLNKLILPQTNAELAEVVVVGYGTQRKKDITAKKEVVFNAAPEGGWETFNKYITEHLNPKLKQNPPARTQVSFQVGNNNKLTDFRFKPSISAEHNLETIRLIREGPAWKLLKGKKATVTINVVF